MLNGLATINIELTSRCNKACAMCGRRKIEREYPELAKWGDMDYALLQTIEKQIPQDIVVQFHNNGEPTLYPRLGDALRLFKGRVRCFNTNGKLLVEKADEIIENMETITVSVVQDDPDFDEQVRIVNEFKRIKGDRLPNIIYRPLGNTHARFEDGEIVAKRILHSPMGSFDYEKEPVVPEIGVCLDFLHHPAIDRYGDVSFCVRFDPHREGVMGDLNKDSLDKIWNSSLRQYYLDKHIRGLRRHVPLCCKCEYWGCPRS